MASNIVTRHWPAEVSESDTSFFADHTETPLPEGAGGTGHPSIDIADRHKPFWCEMTAESDVDALQALLASVTAFRRSVQQHVSDTASLLQMSNWLAHLEAAGKNT